MEEQYCLELVLRMNIPFTIPGLEKGVYPTNSQLNDVIEQIKEALIAMEVEDINVIFKKATKCQI